ncbi:unnamed protein product [Leptidea sinapis]|uniref:Uncharacterized protein n=1 Tax=Leptidea sinapis TaxID=189913 RepID=A0A5E4R076_9NEOP|nr:unnamed protein product [Leptidea sinapis]
MLGPDGTTYQNDVSVKDEEDTRFQKSKRIPIEGTSGMELNSLKSSRNWKKSITKFFRNQLRSTRSNDGDRPSGSNEKFEEKNIAPEQKWQSLGKVFRRQSFVDNWQRSPGQAGETSSQNKRFGVRKEYRIGHSMCALFECYVTYHLMLVDGARQYINSEVNI